MRIFLAGRVAVESDGVASGESPLPGRQGRLLFAYLVAAQGRQVPRDELADVLWEGTPPTTWDKALGVLASKLRGALGTNGGTLTAEFGCYRLELPESTWIDIVAAADAASAAEAALAAGDVEGARRAAAHAESLTQQPFLPGDDGPWVEMKRRELAAVRARALTALADASLRSGDAAESVRWAEHAIEVEPYRESGYRQLMEAHVAAGNGSEALRVYERCRTFLADELGAYPSAETEALYRSLLEAPATPPPGRAAGPRRVRRRVAVLVAVVVVVAGAAAAAVVAVERRSKPAPTVVPNSLVRIDPHTLRVTKVVPVESQPDLVVVAGGYVWNTNFILRDINSGALRNGGDRTLTRVDPATGKAIVVGGGLAPCGLTADPSGDVWVANCYPPASGSRDNVIRVNAKTLEFEKTIRVDGGEGFLRGLAYGGGSLWISEIFGGDVQNADRLTRLNPQTGSERAFPSVADVDMAWAGSYGDLWTANFDYGTMTRLHTATGVSHTLHVPLTGPSFPLIDGDVVWTADWHGPEVARLSAVGAPRPKLIRLPTVDRFAGVWSLAAGDGYIWATTARDGSLWRIDPKTNAVKRIPLPYLPTGVAADANDVWVTVRGE